MSIPEIMATIYLILGMILGTYWLMYWQPDSRVRGDLFTQVASLVMLFFILIFLWFPILIVAAVGATIEMMHRFSKYLMSSVGDS